MPIRVTCACGKKYQAPNDKAGKAFKCESCKAVIRLPGGAAPETIEVQCACGKSIRVPPSFAGKHGRCKSCGAPLRIPGTGLPKSPAPAPASKPAPSIGALNALASLQLAQDQRPRCPNCGRQVQKEDVLCVGCGTNLQTGVTLSSVGGEKKAERPWWVLPAVAAGAALVIYGAYHIFLKPPPQQNIAAVQAPKPPKPAPKPKPPLAPPQDPKAIQEVALLLSKTEQGRSEAEKALAGLLRLGEKGLPPLRQQVEDRRTLYRLYASGALAIQKDLSRLGPCLEGLASEDQKLRYPAMRMLYLSARRTLMPPDGVPSNADVAASLEAKDGGFVEASLPPCPPVEDLQRALQSADKGAQDLAVVLLARALPAAKIESDVLGDPLKREASIHAWESYLLNTKAVNPETPDVRKDAEAALKTRIADLSSKDAPKVQQAVDDLAWFGPLCRRSLIDVVFEKGRAPADQAILRQNVGEILKRIPPDPAILPDLTKRLLDPASPPIEIETAEELLWALGDETLSPKIAEGLQRPDLPDERAERWVDLLKHWGGKGAVPSLLPGLDHASGTVRRHALRAIAAIGGSPKVRALAAKPVAARLQRAAGAEPKEPDPEIRRQALDTLLVLADPETAPVAAQCLEDASELVRAAAARALGELGGPTAVDALLARLQKDAESSVVIRSASEGITQISLRYRAEQAAIRAKAGKPLRDALDESQKGTDTITRQSLIRALGPAGDEAALSKLYAILKGPAESRTDYRDRTVFQDRIAAAKALSNVRDPNAFPALMEALRAMAPAESNLHSEARALRLAALESLRALAGHDPIARNPETKSFDLALQSNAKIIYDIWQGWWAFHDRKSRIVYDEALGRFTLTPAFIEQAIRGL